MDATKTTTPGYREHYNINPSLTATNTLDENDNPTGGQVNGVGVGIEWQNGPRGTKSDGTLTAPNGAFIEDVLWAALQRLEFFNETKYRDRGNSLAITHIEAAIQALKDRQVERSYRGVEGKHEV